MSAQEPVTEDAKTEDTQKNHSPLPWKIEEGQGGEYRPTFIYGLIVEWVPFSKANCTLIVESVNQHAALLVAHERLKAEEAEHHNIITALWAITDPEGVDKELMARIHRVLGVESTDGHCGNDICAQLAALEAEVERLKAERAWQSIEKAPKDGTTILLRGTGWMRTGYWARRVERWSVDTAVSLSMPVYWLPLPRAEMSRAGERP